MGPDHRGEREAAVNMTLARAIRGPVMLILIGTLFAIDYGGGPRVSRTWPVLIIGIGLLKLADYAGTKSA